MPESKPSTSMPDPLAAAFLQSGKREEAKRFLPWICCRYTGRPPKNSTLRESNLIVERLVFRKQVGHPSDLQLEEHGIAFRATCQSPNQRRIEWFFLFALKLVPESPAVALESHP